ncbi:putative DNA-binding protein, partial [Trifolium medium]|nr:putative DNA-binding protein [Trifolium medium]
MEYYVLFKMHRMNLCSHCDIACKISILSYDLLQSFQNKGFWMPQDVGCLAEENIGYENSSRIEQKRSHQWFMDTGEPGIFSNKKQAVEAANDRPVSAVNVSQWDTGSGFHSLTGQFSDRLFGSDLIRSVNSVDKNIQSIGNGNLNMSIKDFVNQYGNDPSVGLSISHNIGGSSSCLNFGGIRKVKVNQVRDSDNGTPAASIGNSYSISDNTFSIGSDYNKNDGNISSGSTYNNGSDNTIAI